MHDPGVHDRDAVRDDQGLFLVVGHVQGGGAQGPLDVPDLFAHLDPQLGVQVRQGLVHEQDLGLDDHRPGQADSLLLPAAQLVRGAFLVSFQAGHLEHPGDPPLDVAGRHLAGLQPESHVFEHGHVGKHRVVLEYHARVALVGRNRIHELIGDVHVPRVLAVETRYGTQQGGLAAPRRSQEGEELPAFDPLVDVDQGLDSGKALVDLFQPYR